MRYMLLIYADPVAYATIPEAQQQAEYQEYFRITDDWQKSGAFVSGDPLQPVNTATTVRVQNGKKLTTDGPFAETKEHLVGYYVLNCENLDQALDAAAKIPDARHGSIEVRPVMDMQMPTGA